MISLPAGRKVYFLVAFALLIVYWSSTRYNTLISRYSVPAPTSLSVLRSRPPTPVHHNASLIDFTNHPVSLDRWTEHQFEFAIDETLPPSVPTLVIITALRQPSSSSIADTFKSLRHQSFTNWEWIIVTDRTSGGNDDGLIESLQVDSRVKVISHEENGELSARNVGLEYALTLETGLPQYLIYVDENDSFELTALEKVIWMLESNQDWAIGGFYFNRFGKSNETVTKGLHNGRKNYDKENNIPNSAIVRSSAVVESKCRYDKEEIYSDAISWDFWMCLAQAGYWGGTVPEILNWRQSSIAIDSTSPRIQLPSTRLKIQKRYGSLSTSFPAHPARWSKHLEGIPWTMPYVNSLDTSTKSIMFVLPWLYLGGIDDGISHMIQLFAESGYRVTVVCTLHKTPEGLELLPFVSMWTRDVHILPAFLRANDMPRYIKHLITSRGIQEVILSNSQLVYELLPALVEHVPHVKFIDYLHHEAFSGWKSGGFPTYSIIYQRFLARTIASSYYLKNWVIERGHAADRVGVVKLGFERNNFLPVSAVERDAAKQKLFHVGAETIVITVTAHMDVRKQPWLVPRIAAELSKLGGAKFIIVMLGDGALLKAVRASVKSLRVEHLVKVMGGVSNPEIFLAATDILLLPALSEGISIAVAEAMSMGIPIVASRVGALSEQLGEKVLTKARGLTHQTPPQQLAGILVNPTLNMTIDAQLYAHQLYALTIDPGLRERHGAIGIDLVKSSANWRETLQGLFPELDLARKASSNKAAYHNPEAHMAIQSVLLEANAESDFAAQPRFEAPVRVGSALDLQQHCGESRPGDAPWIEALSQAKGCQPGFAGNISRSALIRSATFQCEAWCIYDLTSASFGGWSYNGACMTVMTKASDCEQYWAFRPPLVLVPAPDGVDDWVPQFKIPIPTFKPRTLRKSS